MTLCEGHEPGESSGNDKNLPEYLQLEQHDHDLIECLEPLIEQRDKDENPYFEPHTYEEFGEWVTQFLIYIYNIVYDVNIKKINNINEGTVSMLILKHGE